MTENQEQIPDLVDMVAHQFHLQRKEVTTGNTVATSKRKGQVIPIPIPQASQSPGGAEPGGPGGGSTKKTVIINELNSFITRQSS